MDQLPSDDGIEVAFVGRSNAGKSSALNALTSQKGLARTSKTPGRTQLINLFALDETRRLVDLPGFGYAKVPEKIKELWHQLLDRYLRGRNCLKGLVLLVDIRREMRDFDSQILKWTSEAHLPVHVLLTKADKLSYGARKTSLHKVEKILAKHGKHQISVQLFSSTSLSGVDELRSKLDVWFGQ